MNEYMSHQFESRPCTQMSVLDLQGPVSRLPRPVAGLRRSRVVSSREKFHIGLPAIDTSSESNNAVLRNVHASNWTDGSGIPISRLTSDKDSSRGERYRPKTSYSETSVLLRRKASGKSKLLHKLQTMSLERAGREEEEMVAARFARFEPLPAIRQPTTSEEEEESFGSREDESSLEGSATSSSKCDSSEIVVPNSEDLFFESGAQSASEVFEDNFEVKELREDKTVFAERPATSYALQRSWKPLVRSQTYDILPSEEDAQETLDEKVDGSLSLDLSMKSSSSLGFLLAIRSPLNEEHVYGYFQEEDTLRTVLEYALKRMENVIEAKWKLAEINDCGDVQCLDLTKTIGETKLRNRTVLNIID